MREIKFRGWDDYNKVMINPYCELKDNHFWGEDLVNTGYQTPTAVMQFTGLRDRNGREIYEGDIMCWQKFVGTEHYSQWVVNIDPMRATKTWWSTDDDAIVIGNIYENPELING